MTDWGKIGRYALAVSVGFGLGAAYVEVGIQAGVMFWLVMVLVCGVKIAVVTTYTAARKSSKQWEALLAVRPTGPGLNQNQPGDRIHPWPRPAEKRPSPAI